MAESRCMGLTWWEDTTDARTGDYYYVRVTQEDEEMAWSSPVWLDVT